MEPEDQSFKKDQAKSNKHLRRNFLWTALVTAIFWLAIVFFVLNFSPDSTFNIAVFFFLAFWSLWLPFSIIFVNARRGFLVTIGILGTMALKPLGMFSYLAVGAWWAILAVASVFT